MQLVLRKDKTIKNGTNIIVKIRNKIGRKFSNAE